MTKKKHPPPPYPTVTDQRFAIHVIIRLALLNRMSSVIIDELRSFSEECGAEVGMHLATVMIMMAGAAVPDADNWKQLLNDHLAGAVTSDYPELRHQPEGEQGVDAAPEEESP